MYTHRGAERNAAIQIRQHHCNTIATPLQHLMQQQHCLFFIFAYFFLLLVLSLSLCVRLSVLCTFV
jgi:hypothetical protein